MAPYSLIKRWLLREPSGERMSEIKTNVVYNPRLTFDAWAKNLIELPPEHRVGYTVVTAEISLESGYRTKSWKADPKAKAFQDLVMAAVKAFGGVLEGRTFYFTRDISQGVELDTFKVTLYVLER